MSISIEIKINEYDPVICTPQQIAEFMNLEYGVPDDFYCLDKGQTGQFTVLYDKNRIGRGFEVWNENESVCLRLPLPTTAHDIDIFHKTVETVCQKMNVYFFSCEGETVAITDLYRNADEYKHISMQAIHHIQKDLADSDSRYMILFGALNPVFIGQSECMEVGDNPDGFDNLMHRLQSVDAFYATPMYYQRRDGSVFGTYFIGENIVTTVPLNPADQFHKIDALDSYYVRLPDGNHVPYDDFITNIRLADYYDAGHITVNLTEENISELVDHFNTDTTTRQRVKGIYWGKLLDSGYWHSSKVNEMELDTEEINGYNHLAVFLRWAKENNYLSDNLKKICPEILQKNPDYRNLIKDHFAFNCCLRIAHFSEDIQDFVRKFYSFSDNGFPSCVDRYAEKVLGSKKYHCAEYKDEAYLFVIYNEEYYNGMSEYIDTEFKNYNK